MSYDPNAVGAKPTPVASSVASSPSFTWASGDNGPSADVASAEMSFGDFLDIVNPLHHIPVVGSVYRNLSGDTIAASSRIMGGTLYGGPIGMLAAAAESGWEAESGRSVGGTMLAMARGEPMRDPTVASPYDAAIAQAVPERSVATAAVPTIQYASAAGTTDSLSDADPQGAAVAASAERGAESGAVPTIAAQRVIAEPLAPPVPAAQQRQVAQVPNARIPYAASPYAQQHSAQPQQMIQPQAASPGAPAGAPRIMDYDQAAAGMTAAPAPVSTVAAPPPGMPAPVDPQSLMGGAFSPTGVSKTGLPSAGAATPAAAIVQMNAYGAANPAQINAATAAAGPALDAKGLSFANAPGGAAATTANGAAANTANGAAQAPATVGRATAATPGMTLPQRSVSMQAQVPPALVRRETQTADGFVPPPRSDFVSAQRREQRAALAQPAAPAPTRVQQAAPHLAPSASAPNPAGVMAPPTPPAAVSDQMMKALDKYDALMRSRKNDRSSSAGAPIDAVL